MPTVFHYRGMRVHFLANEGEPREPIQVHVETAEAKARLWLYPQVKLPTIGGIVAESCA
jgi:hypothetical protein